MKKIITYPNKKLTLASKKIKDFNKELVFLVDEMIETMRKNNGVGLAAIQIGKPLQIITIEHDPANMDKESIKVLRASKNIPLTVIINPKITYFSDVYHVAPEGCLSFPGVEKDIPRALEIKVLAYNLKGERIKIRAKDFFARILQHEIDHLSGITINDK